MPKAKKKNKHPNFRIFHWDTFDSATLLIGSADTLENAEAEVKRICGKRLDDDGADVINIVDKNDQIVKKFSVR